MTALRGRHALITGAGTGIGAAIARRLAAEGATLMLLGRRLDRLQHTATEIASALPNAIVNTVVCDVTSPDAVRQVFAAIGPVHILVNNAGQAASATVARTSDELWERMLAVNLTGTFHCARAALPGMVAGGWGRIVNVASTAGLRGYAYAGAYAAAKHGVIGLTRSLALEVATRGITVNAVCPGFVETEMLSTTLANVMNKTGRSLEDARTELQRFNPQQRFVQPDEVADAVAWLCAPGAGAITGQAVSVSGGEVM
jgi:NAD(P)-dependent dehydrogenase (short-subunit alcohol dehydrogenase family)